MLYFVSAQRHVFPGKTRIAQVFTLCSSVRLKSDRLFKVHSPLSPQADFKAILFSAETILCGCFLGGDRQWKMAVPRDERVLNSSFSKAFRHGWWKQENNAMRGGNLESRQRMAKSFNLLVYWAYVFLWHPGLRGKCVNYHEGVLFHASHCLGFPSCRNCSPQRAQT